MTKRKLELLWIVVCVASAIACDSRARNLNQPPRPTHVDQAAQTLTLEIPNASWEPTFFEALEKRTKNAGMTSLRNTVLPDGDLEVRFWYDRFEVIAGVIVRRSGGNWSASYLRQREQHLPSSALLASLGTPRSGWEVAWERLRNAAILTLPDGSTSNCSSGALDGIGYVVETNVDWKYRTYRYGNPQWADCLEAKQILSIEKIIFEEFRLGSVPDGTR
jgi:hypothetical protein